MVGNTWTLILVKSQLSSLSDQRKMLAVPRRLFAKGAEDLKLKLSNLSKCFSFITGGSCRAVNT
jgi:hypothetical protein